MRFYTYDTAVIEEEVKKQGRLGIGRLLASSVTDVTADDRSFWPAGWQMKAHALDAGRNLEQLFDHIRTEHGYNKCLVSAIDRFEHQIYTLDDPTYPYQPGLIEKCFIDSIVEGTDDN